MAKAKFAAQWKERREAQHVRFQALAAEARRELEMIVQVLSQQYGVERVILFGSLAKGRFAPWSDVDVVVEGLDNADFYEAMAAVNRLTPRWVDLKPLEDLEPFFRERVMKEGEVIFPERKPGK